MDEWAERWLETLEKLVAFVNDTGQKLGTDTSPVGGRYRLVFRYYRGWLDKVLRAELLRQRIGLGPVAERDPAGLRLLATDSLGDLLDRYGPAQRAADRHRQGQSEGSTIHLLHEELQLVADGIMTLDSNCADDHLFVHHACAEIFRWKKGEERVQRRLQAFLFACGGLVVPLNLVASDQLRLRRTCINPGLDQFGLPHDLG